MLMFFELFSYLKYDLAYCFITIYPSIFYYFFFFLIRLHRKSNFIKLLFLYFLPWRLYGKEFDLLISFLFVSFGETVHACACLLYLYEKELFLRRQSLSLTLWSVLCSFLFVVIVNSIVKAEPVKWVTKHPSC